MLVLVVLAGGQSDIGVLVFLKSLTDLILVFSSLVELANQEDADTATDGYSYDDALMSSAGRLPFHVNYKAVNKYK